jgi:geranylgeranyl pyrophosphate synthase
MVEFRQYIESTRKEIQDHIKITFRLPFLSDSKEFKDMVEYYNRSQGKLLRPLLCAMFCDALGGHHEEAISLGSAVEQIHGGSLMHDDIIDADLFRRGIKSMHEQFAVIPAILFGDNMMASGLRALDTIAPQRMPRAFSEFSTSVDRLSTGASKEHQRNPWNRGEYIFVLQLKTATAFRAAARLGTITADSSEGTTEIAGRIGEEIGVAFQVADDITDITKSINIGQPVGDVKDGKVTLPVMHLHNKYQELKDECDNYCNGVSDLKEIPRLIASMDEGISSAKEFITERLSLANEYLKFIPLQNGYRQLLQEYGEFAVSSILNEA